MTEPEYPKLSDQQKEALRLTLAGKSVRGVAAELGINKSSVERLMEVSRRKMRAGTNKQAAEKAKKLGQI